MNLIEVNWVKFCLKPNYRMIGFACWNSTVAMQITGTVALDIEGMLMTIN